MVSTALVGSRVNPGRLLCRHWSTIVWASFGPRIKPDRLVNRAGQLIFDPDRLKVLVE